MINQEKRQAKTEESVQIIKWQKKLLPWLIIMPTLLVAVFIFLATQQLIKFNNTLEAKPDSTLIGTILPYAGNNKISDKIINSQSYLQWITLAKLEQESLYRRYNQGGQLLMSRIYTKYLGFFTGMIMAIVGAVFIIGKIQEDTTAIEGSAKDIIKFRIVSSSPGVIFGFLGTILMAITMITHNDIVITDSPLYLKTPTIQSNQLPVNFQKETTKIDTTGLDTLWNTSNNE